MKVFTITIFGDGSDYLDTSYFLKRKSVNLTNKVSEPYQYLVSHSIT